ncbi:metallophosphoesterase [Phyllobacterium sp. 21LDTY02-6]|jgi:3',5'-cyclic AMP phosphodiesterase CpdA|uniref:metallophosphoesterase family protein n=1 Tax=unclassified Phyllobacterium TaxID=2638441 RepID=UPI0020202DB0|nr:MULTISPECIES: metallophosphoesterase [unclassified Phyllobacterium]MCO4315787.1 metallophosphoesterase [Phyllobacterium sp. 21LDTY02-6]MCX8282629.1 metallophosphoesterase [Phyllobacterium sp. 0TCS1.6C]MCX8292020.1 metallophosphoesterase [Phyllobacterium sp. 0TCS1.6A]
MFRLAHISDIHLSPLPSLTLRELISKRITGYINWRSNRREAMAGGALDMVIADLKANAPDHIAVTGDLVNLALDEELETARAWLKTLGDPDDVSVVPGNHDAYVPGALKKTRLFWEAWMRGDRQSAEKSPVEFPYLRVRGDVALIGVSSARATAPFMATGDIRSKQAQKLGEILAETGRRGLFRVVMIHHPPVRGAAPSHKRLLGIGLFQRTVREHGAELVLHGHTHLSTIYQIGGPDWSIPVVCVPSASQGFASSHKPAGAFNLFSIARTNAGWTCRMTERGIVDAQMTIRTIREHELTVGAQLARTY